MTGRAQLQEAILRLIGPSQCLTTAQIAAEIGRSTPYAASALGRLVMRDLVERIERGCYRLTRGGKRWLADGGPALRSGPKGARSGHPQPWRDTLRQRAWTAMRLRPVFTSADILERAARAADLDAPGNLGRYLRSLVAAGIVIETPRRAMAGEAPTSNGRKVYRLVKDVGEIAPRVSPRRGVVDLNPILGRPS